ncbi:hypothetical protein [Mycobacteroides sp. LB1]|uniref:hypothetical protein n=1 Tax=Mycobacteroides sp. LB1 TaxID=2750814 RepID=UPI0015DDB1F3|nr:hypothetical protein [Mycobacteroides sp. LB1]
MLFFILWTLYAAATDSRPDWVQCVIIAVVFGLIMGPISAQRNRREIAPLMAGVAPRDYRHVSKALRIGPPPSDPAILLAAARLARLRGAQGMRERKVSMILMVVGVVVLIAMAEGHSFRLGGYVVAVLFGALGARGWINPLLLQARSVVLAHAAHQNPLPTRLGGTAQPSISVQQNPSSYPLENHHMQRDAEVVGISGPSTGLFSFRGRVACAILVLTIGSIGLWTYFHYRDPEMFWLSLFPLTLGAIGTWDAVKCKRAGLFGVEQ